jgi:branched-chain amino acid transport system substrate-binding protein
MRQKQVLFSSRLALLVSSLWLVSLLVACGDSTTTPAASTSGNTTGVTDSEVVIGSWGPQSGAAAAYSVVDRTIDAYFKKVNAEGGINGRKIKFIFQDDAYQASQTQVVVKKMVEQDKVFAFVAGLGTSNNLAVMDYLVQNGVLNVAPATGSTSMSKPLKKNVFALQTNYFTEATLLTRYAIDTLKVKKIAVFYQDDGFGKEGLDSITEAAKGQTIAAAVSYQPTDKDFSSQALKLQASGADAVIFWSVPGPTGAILQELDRVGYKPTILLTMAANDASLFKLSANTIDGAWISSWLPDVTDPDNPKVVAFREFMAKWAPNETASGFASTGYAQAQLMTEALKRAGKDLTREKLIQALENMKNWNDGLAYNVSYSPENHQGQNSVQFMQADAKTGKFVKKTDFIEYKPS